MIKMTVISCKTYNCHVDCQYKLFTVITGFLGRQVAPGLAEYSDRGHIVILNQICGVGGFFY